MFKYTVIKERVHDRSLIDTTVLGSQPLSTIIRDRSLIMGREGATQRYGGGEAK